jgi:hypothetical protein
MAEPPASGCATRGAGFDATSFEGVSELLLLEELGLWALAGIDTPRKNEPARHREKSAVDRRDDLAGKDTIRIRRSREV